MSEDIKKDKEDVTQEAPSSEAVSYTHLTLPTT